MKFILLRYCQLLKKDKLLLIWSFAFPALIVTIAFLSFHNLISLFCFVYVVGVNLGCFQRFLSRINKTISERNEIFSQEKKQLDFWLNECNRLFAAYVRAEMELRVQDAIDLVKQYDNATKRYSAELQKSAKKYGVNVVIDKK